MCTLLEALEQHRSPSDILIEKAKQIGYIISRRDDFSVTLGNTPHGNLIYYIPSGKLFKNEKDLVGRFDRDELFRSFSGLLPYHESIINSEFIKRVNEKSIKGSKKGRYPNISEQEGKAELESNQDSSNVLYVSLGESIRK